MCFISLQVVYDLEVLNLYGILKQRSVSEFSEDLVSFNSSCSFISLRDELFGFKKFVKFNDYIDQITFRIGVVVIFMIIVLKSKRRRNRKREEKKNGRQRFNSGGLGQFFTEYRILEIFLKVFFKFFMCMCVVVELVLKLWLRRCFNFCLFMYLEGIFSGEELEVRQVLEEEEIALNGDYQDRENEEDVKESEDI